MKTLTFLQITALPEPQRSIKIKEYMRKTIKPVPANSRDADCDCGSGRKAGKCCYPI